MKKILLIMIAMLLTASAFAGPRVNDAAPAFTLKDRDGKDFTLSDAVGPNSREKANGLILSFFASWCVPCRSELPIINSAVDDLKAKGVKVVIVGFRENFETIRALLEELKVDKPLVLSDPQGKVSEQYGVRFLPVTFFIGRDGTVKDVIYGEIGDLKELKEHAKKISR